MREDFNNFPRCKTCSSFRDFSVTLVDEKENIWKLTCLDCGWTETKPHVHCQFETQKGITTLDGEEVDLRIVCGLPEIVKKMKQTSLF